MYHIPLNKRRIVNTQRYSFPGLPCLYLCSSVYTCWVETNRPSFDSFQVAALKVNENVKNKTLLDLSNIPQRLDSLKEEESFNIDEYLLYWPLLAVCSIKVSDESVPFKPEYIFPQFVLEYILENKLDYIGIKYASIKTFSICEKQYEEDRRTYINYVFPTHSNEMKDVLDNELQNMFNIVKNKSGKELEIMTSMIRPICDGYPVSVIKEGEESNNKIREFKKQYDDVKLYTSDGMPYPYSRSEFGIIEIALNLNDFDFDDSNKLEFIKIENKT